MYIKEEYSKCFSGLQFNRKAFKFLSMVWSASSKYPCHSSNLDPVILFASPLGVVQTGLAYSERHAQYKNWFSTVQIF